MLEVPTFKEAVYFAEEVPSPALYKSDDELIKPVRI
jgi:hypothetical protein